MLNMQLDIVRQLKMERVSAFELSEDQVNEFTQLFDLLDTNNNGEIETEELEEALKSVPDYAQGGGH